MNYREILADKLPTHLVKAFWWFENDENRNLDYTILPDGCFDLLVLLRNYTVTEVSLTGIWSVPVDISVGPGTQIFGIRFKPLAAAYFFRKPIAGLLNSEEVLPPSFWQIDTLDFSDTDKVAVHFLQMLHNVEAGATAVDEKKAQLFLLLFSTNGQLTVEAYAAQVFWSARQINRYFNQQLGVSLKQYCTILKLFASFKHIKNGQLYPENNYFDQSHFIKYVKKLTGKSPQELYQNKHDRFLQLTTLAEK